MRSMTSCVQLTEPPSGALNQIVISPKNVVVDAGDSVRFTAKGLDQSGSEVKITPKWQVSGGGTISDSGLFVAAKTTGTFIVTAADTVKDISGSTTILVRWNSPYVASFRASRILSNYPNNQFPGSDYWAGVGDSMAQKFSNTSPAAVWIVSLYMGNGVTQADFPSQGGSYNDIVFSDSDYSESYLTRFDEEGFKVWLQVEPGAASVDTLINLVLSRYGSHPFVVGFGWILQLLKSFHRLP